MNNGYSHQERERPKTYKHIELNCKIIGDWQRDKSDRDKEKEKKLRSFVGYHLRSKKQLTNNWFIGSLFDRFDRK
jgi:hypothetical protein